ncbi:MAG: DUF4293 domain-containing protein [Bacteroidales bacterium]|nr:DUF4293 domain-containing protein [Bacteroidales bacterium]
MIQRIQTLFLILAVACLVATCFLPLGTITTDFSYYQYNAWSLHDTTADQQTIQNTYIIGLLAGILAVLALVAVFLYRNRPVQSKVCMAAMLLNLVLLLFISVIYPDLIFKKLDVINGNEVVLSMWCFLPICSALLFYLASKFINKDEKMVRAADRLR